MRLPIPFLVTLGLAFWLALRHAQAGEIHTLIREGRIDAVKALLAKDSTLVDSLDESWQTPLHLTVSRGWTEMAKILLDAGANVNAVAYNDFTPLHLANDPETIRLLVSRGADIEAKDGNDTPLQKAARLAGDWIDAPGNRWLAIVKTLREAGAYYDFRSACYLGDVERVSELLALDPKSALEKDVIRVAAQHGHAPLVALLLKHGADPEDADYGDSEGVPLLNIAMEHPEVVRVLLDAGADPAARVDYRGNGWGPRDSTLLCEVAISGPIETARLLLDGGASVDSRDKAGGSALDRAALHGRPEMVKFLLDYGASTAGHDGRTAMAAAAQGLSNIRYDTEQDTRLRHVVMILRTHGVPLDLFAAIVLHDLKRIETIVSEDASQIDRKDGAGYSPLHRAVDLDRRDAAILLLDGDACTAAQAMRDGTPLHVAAARRRTELARLLIERGADVNAAAHRGDTPLHQAADWGATAIARLLLDAGADVNAADRMGRTPLDCAVRADARPIVDLLRAAGGKRGGSK